MGIGTPEMHASANKGRKIREAKAKQRRRVEAHKPMEATP